jgi:hypothetical protein
VTRSRRRVLTAAIVCIACGTLASTAAGSVRFRPRVHGALGLVPPVNAKGLSVSQDIASGTLTPVTYHGGAVMAGGITVHAIFWTGKTNAFQGPRGTTPSYEGLIKQFFTDAAHDSGATSNLFSVLPQYAQETGVNGNTPPGVTQGDYAIAYNSVTDSVDDTDAYPASADQCASPNNIATCITDGQVQTEVDHVIAAQGGHRGLHDLWFVFLPPNVDECITPGVCGSTAFAGYHSVSDLGHGPAIYAVAIDPLIELTIGPGSDPQGYPDAESTLNTAGHETVEAMTDPEGVGWMDPNGFEVADKCEFGPDVGSPLGFAGPDSAPFNQVIGGHDYLIQDMWSNPDNACVQSTTRTTSGLPLPQVDMSQFSPRVSGNIASAKAGVGVSVSILRAGADGSPVEIAQGSATTDASGNWSLTLKHPVGDDRDEIDVDYSGAGAPNPDHQVILTGNGGDPFSESGWTGWTDLDNGSFLTNDPSLGGPSLTLAPCFQTGVLAATFDGTEIMGPLSESPTDFCNTQSGTATIGTPTVGPGDRVTVSTNDNRAFAPPIPGVTTFNPNGGLVDLTVPVGEADAVSASVSPVPGFSPSGFPTCSADLQAQTVACDGLVPGQRYAVTDGPRHAGGTADQSGTVAVSLAVHRGDTVGLSNGARAVTTLRVANLRVAITGQQAVLASGTCQPGNYFGGPLTEAPTNDSAGAPSALAAGPALTGEICPLNGDATGLPSSGIGQTDDASGGQTLTAVPDVEDTSPTPAETMLGNFIAVAESGLPGPSNTVVPTDSTSRIALSIAHASGGSPVFTAGNVDTADGVAVNGLSPGTYRATWTLSDANGDTRTVTMRFIELAAPKGQRGPAGPRGPRGPRGRQGPARPRPKVRCVLERHRKVKCTVTFSKAKKTSGTVRMIVARGKHPVALGHGRVRHGKAAVTMRERRRVVRGRWTVTVVLSRPHKAAATSTMFVHMR